MGDDVPRVPARSYLLTLDFDEVGGRLACIRFEVASASEERRGPDPVPVMASVLREIPLGKLIDETLFDHTRMLRQWAREAGPGKGRDLLPRVAAAEAALERRPGRPPLYSEDHFTAVADAYTRAWRIGVPPTKAVADQWDVSISTAGKWVARAREMGLLPPTTRGRPVGGEGAAEHSVARRERQIRPSKRRRQIERMEEQEAYELQVLRAHEAWIAKVTGQRSPFDVTEEEWKQGAVPEQKSRPRKATPRSPRA